MERSETTCTDGIVNHMEASIPLTMGMEEETYEIGEFSMIFYFYFWRGYGKGKTPFPPLKEAIFVCNSRRL